MLFLEAGKSKLSPENMNKAQKSIPQTIQSIEVFSLHGIDIDRIRPS